MTYDEMISSLMNVFYSSISVPKEFHTQTQAVKKMLQDDISGLVSSLTNYYVDTASSVQFEVHTGNQNLDYILNRWMEDINADFNGIIPTGINSLSEEYFKERWQSSSFICLKILAWKLYKDKNGNGLLLPSKLAIVDGQNVYVDEKYLKEYKGKIDLSKPIKYYLGRGKDKREPLNKAVFISKPFDRWFSVYATPFLVGRGVLHNYEILRTIKRKQSDIIVKIIGYLLLVQRGTENLAMKFGAAPLNNELEKIKTELQTKLNELSNSTTATIPMRITMFDEQIEHLIPDFEKFLKSSLTSAVEKSILSGLGWIDVPDSAMSSRRESIVNPKPAIENIKKGIKDFKGLVAEIIKYSLRKQQEKHFKFAAQEIKVYSSGVNSFVTDDMRKHLKSLYDRGVISKQTFAEISGNVVYVIEKMRREKEAIDGEEILMYPPIIQNQEEKESFLETEKYGLTKKETEKDIEAEGKDGIEKKDYENAMKLEGSPYKTIKNLPDKVKNALKSNELKRVFLAVFNRAYNEYVPKYGKEKGEPMAFKAAWSAIKKIAVKTKRGWVKKKGAVKNDK